MENFTNYKLWNTSQLLGVMREQDPIHMYWTDALFPNAMTSDDEYIDFEKIPSQGRKLAPFVAPLNAGRPVYSEGSRAVRFKPAYVKPSDPVTPSRVLKKRPGSLLNDTPQTPQARYNAIKADIVREHRDSIYRRWEWLAAKAIIDGKVVIESDGYPAREVDFGRDPSHTIVKAAGAKWGDPGVSIYDDIQDWGDMMHDAEFGGAPNRLTVTRPVWKIMRKDPEIRENLDTEVRGTDTNLKMGLIGNGDIEYVGRLGANMDVYVYNDYYHDEKTGSIVRLMEPGDIALTSPNVQGYRCFGAIQDAHANFQALPIFGRNWLPQSDPAIEQILHQSAPLMVPVNPNATLKATVL